MKPPMIPDTAEDSFELPLFPLNQVLYPGMFLPLHIFEERYQKMIGACLENKTPFGVMLIKEGQEVGGTAVPVRVGTTARILDTQPMEAGRMNILTRGEQRFELLDILEGSPYLVGRVRTLPDDVGGAGQSAVDATRSAFTTFLGSLAMLADDESGDMHAPDDPTELSYAIASKISASIKLPVEILQGWLECESSQARLATLLPTLNSLNEALEQELLARRPPNKLDLN